VVAMKRIALIIMGLVFFAGCIEKGQELPTAETPSYTETSTSTTISQTSPTSENSEISVTFVVEVPEYTPEGDNIYIAGDFNG